MKIPQYYEFYCPVKIVSGLKALSNLPNEMGILGTKKAIIVTDQGVVNAGLLKQVEAAFEGSGASIGAVYDKTPPDSSNRVVNEVAELYKSKGCDCFVAVGGGSCLDTAKGANMIISEGTNDLMQFLGHQRLTKQMQPFIAVPTTAGTGSEVTYVAVVYNEDKKIKMAFTSYKLFPNVAILDPKMTLTMPPKITAATGMDALTHAIEAYYCLGKNPVSDSFGLAAIDLVMKSLIVAVEHGNDEDARLAMANASLLGGIAFSNSMVGVVHSLAHATGAVARVPHGIANAIYLPWGMEYNIPKVGEHIAELAPRLGANAMGSVEERAKAAVEAIRNLVKKLNSISGMPITLKDAGVKEEQLEAIAANAINDGALTYNPADVSKADALEIIKKAYA